MKSPTRKPKDGSVKWHEALDSDKNKGANGLSVRLPRDRDQCPDIFVYLVLNKDRVSFARFKFDEVRRSQCGVHSAAFTLFAFCAAFTMVGFWSVNY